MSENEAAGSEPRWAGVHAFIAAAHVTDAIGRREKRDLQDQLRGFEPADRASQWREALDPFERASMTAADGPVVDVTGRDLGRSVEQLVDRFGLDVCF